MLRKYFLLVFLIIAPVEVYAQVNKLPDFTDLVENNGAAVVNISTIQKQRTNGDQIFQEICSHFPRRGERSHVLWDQASLSVKMAIY